MNIPRPTGFFLAVVLDMEMPNLPLSDWVQIGSSVMAGLLVVAGIIRPRPDRKDVLMNVERLN